ncbi:MAG: RNA-binding S4 domain-containing protein [Hyphomonas sp.]|uniref:RNA-binding S4 domain-containing protein n=1 Tax=Hyphomonas sp. TaxID=87 RepID=UPI0017CF6DA2|nr:RNA-binding S4 domain-containing protein [Hyphomonas sp.]MBA3070265.1 RNA-binding S4 domain-containing protein [Hyphomonas sp.]MBU3919412.1 RNA-binding S4 domain-containing protein [Alphaproteobacteria bacterium]MBU4062750.1 RNA-binding S4 domain-containing protein [Alphaproteobacteria bacterium]MBU4163669.1 RNA-binding S4 domain-containing protein [Alphaproteobacteria bacterium]
MTPAGGTDTSVRVDVWLWRARFFRTRALSTAYVRKSGLRLSQAGATRRTDKPGASLAVGDIVTFGKGADILSVEVLDLGTRRGPADEARSLYRPLELPS